MTSQSSQSHKANGAHGAGIMLEHAAITYGVAKTWQALAKKRGLTVVGDVQAQPNGQYDLLTDPQYPQGWDNYVGQPEAKAQLQAAVNRAKARGETVRHVLIACPEPGIGKTALAVLLAREIGSRCFTISGTPTPQQVRSLLLGMRPGDVLFIDEIHRLVNGGKAKAEWLLHVLQDDCLMGPTGPEKSGLGITVVGATTDVGLLPETIIDRFGIKPTLVRYDAEDAMHIAANHCLTAFAPDELPPTEDIVALIYAADLNPRKIKQLLEQAVDCLYDPEGYSLDLVLRRANMTIDGLDRTMQRYLLVLRQAMGPMGQAQLKSLLQEATLTYPERRLADKGYITFTKSGRQLTAEGHQRSGELLADGVTI